jgi:sucrose-6-phosphate hydrolase SacC (GH32 family)
MLSSEFHNITKTSVIRLRVRQSLDKSEYTEMKYVGEKNMIELDRSHSGNIGFHPLFRTHYNMTLDQETLTTGTLKLQLLVDRCSVEIFINNGKYTMTGLVFPKSESHQMELSVEGEEIILNYLELMLISL